MTFRSRLQKLGTALLMAGAVAGCAIPARDAAPGLVVVVVRHAEKQQADALQKDPPLSRSGLERAQRLTELMRGQPVAAVYSTDYRRTRDTAAPTAEAAGVPVTLYDAAMPAAELARQLLANHAAGTILIVAHSNTAPQIAQALCTCPVQAMDESEYGRRMTVAIGAVAVMTQIRDP